VVLGSLAFMTLRSWISGSVVLRTLFLIGPAVAGTRRLWNPVSVRR